MDPLSRRDFWGLINRLAEGGTTVLVTTHYLDEAEYANRLLLIHAGRIVAEGSPGELKRQARTDSGAAPDSPPTLEEAFVRLIERQSGEAGLREAVR